MDLADDENEVESAFKRAMPWLADDFALKDVQQQQQHSLFSQASWGRLEMKPERNKFKVQAH